MSTSELYRDLDPKIAGPIARVTEALKAEITRQIDGIREEVRTLAGTGARGARSEPSAAPDQLDPLEELKLAAAGIDRSTKQAAILTGLLEGAGRFSSRAVFILLREDGETCWGSLGFEDSGRAMQGQTVNTPNGDSPWSRVREGAGTVALSAEECAAFCSQFDAPPPAIGALLPLSLGDHVAGYLYADRLGDGLLNISALQLLTFVAGQTLETLPVRQRSSTPTLTVAATAPAPAPTPEVAEPEPPAPEPSPPAAAVEVESAAIAPVEPAPEVTPPEPEIVSAPEVTAPPAEPEPEPEVAAPPPEPEPESEAAAPPPEAEPEPEPVAMQPDELVEAGAPAAPPMDLQPEGEEPAAVETAPSGGADGALVMPLEDTPEPRTEPEPPPPAAPTPPEPPTPPAESSSTQVVPPEDVRGPGWAFTTQEASSDSGNEALHEEARRLARLLVTEIKLYNEEQVEQGRRSGDIYRRLQEDIDRSRQIFEDRIDPAIRSENDYFREALVRILAGGDESLLGM